MPRRVVSVPRRAVLRGFAGVAGAAILAACGSDGATITSQSAPAATTAQATPPVGATLPVTAISTTAATRMGALPLTLDSSTRVTIEFWYSVVSTPAVEAIRENVRRFGQAFPNVTVMERNFPSYTELTTAVQVASAAKTPPALAGIGLNFQTYTAATFPHLTIAEAAQRDPQGMAWLTDNFIPSILDLGKVDGLLHAMPLGISVPLIFFNRDLLGQAGLERPPQTWAEIPEVARRVTAKTRDISFAIRDNASMWSYQALLESNGARLLIGSGANARIGIDSPEAAAAMQLVADMALKDKTTAPIAAKDVQPSFFAGKLAMAVDSSSNVANYELNTKVPFGTVPFPTFGAKPRRVPGGGQSLFIFATNRVQQAAAWELVKSFNSPESLTAWHKGINYLPTRKGLAEDPRFLKPVFGDNPLYKSALDQIPDAAPWASWPGKNGLQIDKEVFDVVGKVLSGDQDAPTALREAAQRANELLKA